MTRRKTPLASSELKTYFRVIELAERGIGNVEPNPPVGALILKGGRVIAEGYHAKFGGPHAEIVALTKAGTRAKGATLLSTLEPCTHQGKTPPCVEAIGNAGIKKVIYLAEDPNPKVHGSASRYLARKGIRCEYWPTKAGHELVKGFRKWITTGIPYVTLKAAVSIDGRIADHTGKSRGLGSPFQQRVAHGLRFRSDAILVGAGTVTADDPMLTIRHSHHHSHGLKKIVLDRSLSISTKARLLRGPRSGPIWIVADPEQRGGTRSAALGKAGAEVIFLNSRSHSFIPSMLKKLGDLGVNNLLVEGGSAIFAQFLKNSAFDEFHIHYMPIFLGEQGIPLARLGKIQLQRAERFYFQQGWGGKHSGVTQVVLAPTKSEFKAKPAFLDLYRS